MPGESEIRIWTDPKVGVHVVRKFGTLAVDGQVTGSVRVLLDQSRTIVTSTDLVAQFADLTLEPAEEDEPTGMDVPPLVADLRIRTGRRVRFFWPSRSLPIVTATARQSHVMNIGYDEDTGTLTLAGDVRILGGDMFFFDRSFRIREGEISFNEDALQFDPRLTVYADIRERDTENRDIRVYLDVDRVRLSDLSAQTISFTSDPPMSEADILALISTSIFSRTAQTDALPLLATLTGDVVSRMGILQPLEEEVRKFLGLDLLSIRTQIVQNFLVEKILVQDAALDNTTSTLGKYLGNTELAIGKYIGNDLFFEMMVRLQAAGQDSRSEFARMSGLQTDFEISLEWDTPFFILDWSFLPKHPEDLFVTDNTVGIRWRFDY